MPARPAMRFIEERKEQIATVTPARECLSVSGGVCEVDGIAKHRTDYLFFRHDALADVA
jgi:hypothetical protein